jgi:hypothetical protein
LILTSHLARSQKSGRRSKSRKIQIYTDCQCKINGTPERSIRHSAEIDELGCVKTSVTGIRKNITKLKGINYLYGQWNQLLQDKHPVIGDELTTWGIKNFRQRRAIIAVFDIPQ